MKMHLEADTGNGDFKPLGVVTTKSFVIDSEPLPQSIDLPAMFPPDRIDYTAVVNTPHDLPEDCDVGSFIQINGSRDIPDGNYLLVTMSSEYDGAGNVFNHKLGIRHT